jgi:hypothetical protein
MKLIHTINAALAASILAPTRVAEYIPGQTGHHGRITTANSSLFTQAHFSEPMTTYALGWSDPAGYTEASDFLAPPLPESGERYEHIEYPNAEAFLSDGSYEDLRAIGGDFKTVDYTQTKHERTIPNRGLRMEVDIDRVKNMPNWQQVYTGMLMQRLQRNAFRRKYALAVAGATNQALTWGSSADPDYDVANYAKLSGDSSGVQPNRALWGLGAQLLRFSAYGAQATAGAFGGRSMSPAEACAKIGLGALVDESRYQNGTSKSSIVGAVVLLFRADSASGIDPSNLKTARGNTPQGGRYAVYIRQLTVKLWEIVVECYETEFVASTLGLRTLTIS